MGESSVMTRQCQAFIYILFTLYTYSKCGPESSRCALSGEDVRGRLFLISHDNLEETRSTNRMGNLTVFPFLDGADSEYPGVQKYAHSTVESVVAFLWKPWAVQGTEDQIPQNASCFHVNKSS